MAAIKADGSVVVCKLHRDKASMVVGNINEETFQNIWLNTRRQKIVRSLEQEGCSSCCGYKDFNRHVMLTREAGGAQVDHALSYSSGIQRFAEDINFI
jgi:MoaA/NifB/PqqE/SkfB family radical SAM enzyme